MRRGRRIEVGTRTHRHHTDFDPPAATCVGISHVHSIFEEAPCESPASANCQNPSNPFGSLGSSQGAGVPCEEPRYLPRYPAPCKVSLGFQNSGGDREDPRKGRQVTYKDSDILAEISRTLRKDTRSLVGITAPLGRRKGGIEGVA